MYEVVYIVLIQWDFFQKCLWSFIVSSTVVLLIWKNDFSSNGVLSDSQVLPHIIYSESNVLFRNDIVDYSIEIRCWLYLRGYANSFVLKEVILDSQFIAFTVVFDIFRWWMVIISSKYFH